MGPGQAALQKHGQDALVVLGLLSAGLGGQAAPWCCLVCRAFLLPVLGSGNIGLKASTEE